MKPKNLTVGIICIRHQITKKGIANNASTPIKKNLGGDFMVVTPGIRPSWAEKSDQKRTATPREAFDRGADYIVIGRPITREPDPKAAAERIIGELE